MIICSSVNLTLTWRTSTITARAWRRKIPRQLSKAFKGCLTSRTEKRVCLIPISSWETICYCYHQVNGGSKRWNRWSRSTSGWAISEKWWQGMIACLQHMCLLLFSIDNVDNLLAKELRTIPLILFELRYKQLLTYIKSAVTRNHSEKSINSILDYISTSKQVKPIFC